MVSVQYLMSDLSYYMDNVSSKYYGRKTLLDTISIMTETKYEDLDSPLRRIHSVIQCSKPLLLTLNSQKGLHSIHLSTPENPSIKMKACMRGALEIYLLGCARDACVTYEIDEAMDTDLDELGVRKFYRNFIMTVAGLLSRD